MIRIFNFLERFPFFLPSCSYSCSPLLPTLRTHTFHAMTLNFPGEEAFENFFITEKKVENCQTTMVMYFLCVPWILSFLLPVVHSLGKKLRMLSYQDYFSFASETAFESQKSFISFSSMAWWFDFMQYFEWKKNFCDYIIVIDFSLSLTRSLVVLEAW